MIVRFLGACDYLSSWQAMKVFTEKRTQDTQDEIWFLEHPKVFTLGQAANLEHVLNLGEIPILYSDRGGQVTYHGPGQLVVYTLFNLTHHSFGVKNFVHLLESIVINLLKKYKISANARPEAPGIYVQDAKIASLGLRIRRGCSYHGIALNVSMDLEPFSRIHPCGQIGLPVTQISDFVSEINSIQVARDLVDCFAEVWDTGHIDFFNEKHAEFFSETR
ncbi:lipoyl(octanoyl) transferase [Gammaproteobacteria bacterium]